MFLGSPCSRDPLAVSRCLRPFGCGSRSTSDLGAQQPSDLALEGRGSLLSPLTTRRSADLPSLLPVQSSGRLARARGEPDLARLGVLAAPPKGNPSRVDLPFSVPPFVICRTPGTFLNAIEPSGVFLGTWMRPRLSGKFWPKFIIPKTGGL